MNLKNISGAIQVLVNWYNTAAKLGQVVGDNSYNDLTKNLQVEPLVIVSKECLGLEPMQDIMQGLLRMTAADYMQAVAIFGRVDDILVRRALERFNPARDGNAGALISTINLESYSQASQFFSLPIGGDPTLEAKDSIPQQGGGKMSIKDIQEEAKNMSVGMMVDVPFTPSSDSGGRQVTLPMRFRLLVSYVNSNSLTTMLANGEDDTGFWARFERARDSGISPFVDFILAQDMIDEKKKIMFSDDGKIFTKIQARAAANKRAALASRNPSLATLANIFVMTEAEEKALAAKMGRTLENEAAREQIFRNVFASTIVVVNRGYNQVTFWNRGRDSATVLDFKQLKAQASGKGPDLMDMFRQFNLGMPIA